LDPAVSETSDSIIMTILFLINDPNYRNIIRLHLDLPKLFSIFTDVDLPLETAKDKGGFIENENFLVTNVLLNTYQ
jgi:Rapamycin-insensitive companion of mTOR, N-term